MSLGGPGLCPQNIPLAPHMIDPLRHLGEQEEAETEDWRIPAMGRQFGSYVDVTCIFVSGCALLPEVVNKE